MGKVLCNAKEIERDLALIDQCLKLVNQSINHGHVIGENYNNESIHNNISSIEKTLTKIKKKVVVCI